MNNKVLNLANLAGILFVAIIVVIILISCTERNLKFMTGKEQQQYIMNHLTESLIDNYYSEYDATTGTYYVDATR